jgi:hypothetical protein
VQLEKYATGQRQKRESLRLLGGRARGEREGKRMDGSGPTLLFNDEHRHLRGLQAHVKKRREGGETGPGSLPNVLILSVSTDN